MRSIRVRILVPVLVATVGVMILGTVQISDALSVAGQADSAAILSEVETAAAELVHEIGLEAVATGEVDRRGSGVSTSELKQQIGRTDDARVAYLGAISDARGVAPSLIPLFNNAEGALKLLAVTRAEAQGSPDFSIQVTATYDAVRRSLLAVAEAVPPLLGETVLIEDARATALVAELDLLASQQLDLLLRAFTNEALLQGELVQLADIVGRERRNIEALQTQPGSAGSRYDALVAGPEFTRAAQLRDTVLSAGIDKAALDNALSSVRPADWREAQGQVPVRLAQLAEELGTTLKQDTQAVSDDARNRTLLLSAVTGLIVAVTLTTAVLLAVRTSRRLRRMRYAALTVARSELPSAVSNVIASSDADAVRNTLQDSWARIDALLVPGPDEIGELAAAFGAVHRQALRLAADQALLRVEVEAMFVALSRRGQTLVQRQIHLIDEFGRNEADPDALERLFALDHLAARMRRNEENLLVLAGAEPARWVTTPVPVVDVIRAAAQEIEEYRRVTVTESPPMAISAHVAGSVIHLLAELLENATSYSPPTTTVRVSARRSIDGLTITVYDEGIGMPAVKLAEANHRLARPSGLTSSLVGTMGLLVVARLAQRHGMRVWLSSVPAGGTAASLSIPQQLLDPLAIGDQLTARRFSQSHAIRAEEPAAIPAQRVGEPIRAALPSMPVPAPAAPAEPALPRFEPAAAAAAAAGAATDMSDTGPGNGGFVGSARVPGAAPSPYPAARASLPATPPADGAPPADAEPEPVTFTTAGLPKRGAGASLTDNANGAPVTPTGAAGTPNPDDVRARLSSLAKGLAAANRYGPPASTAPPNR
jgi:signal transduction histidine kinase